MKLEGESLGANGILSLFDQHQKTIRLYTRSTSMAPKKTTFKAF